MGLVVNGNTIETDRDGFIADLSLWNQDLAIAVAHAEDITLTEKHWEVIYLVRNFYKKYQHSPEMRPLVKFAAQVLGSDKGNSIYLLSLFPDSPAKKACKIAGLPRPANCL